MIDLRCGNVLDVLQTMDAESVHCIVTSPPYWGLRAYGTEPQVWANGHDLCIEHQWETQIVPAANGQTTHGMIAETLNGNSATRRPRLSNTCAVCGAWKGELGLEPTPELFVDHLVQIFREARRVLRADGTAWINLGDSYNGSGGYSGDHTPSAMAGSKQTTNKGSHKKILSNAPNLKPKDLVGIPWHVAFALQADGWYLRSEIIWAKPNPMPESVRDRPTRSHEQIFLLTKSPRYFYDTDAVREPITDSSVKRIMQENFDNQTGGEKDYRNGTNPNRSMRQTVENFARKTKRAIADGHSGYRDADGRLRVHPLGRNRRSVWTVTTKPFKGAHFATFPPDLIEPCILAGCPKDGTVLDPFGGAGTTALVAAKHGRNAILIDLNPEYIEMARARLEKAQLTMGAT